ncbi:MAG: reverse transcriptase family protein, partial [Bacteroidota bacterium]
MKTTKKVKSACVNDASDEDPIHECPIWQELCSVDSEQSLEANVGAIGHHVYSQSEKRWMKRTSIPQPLVKISASIDKDDYSALGLELKARPKNIQVTAVGLVDTGCQSCLAGYEFARRLGMTKAALAQTKLSMYAANKSRIDILGVIVVRFCGKDKHGQAVETRQMVYISNSTCNVYLSREACIDLGIISSSFPTIGYFHTTGDQEERRPLSASIDVSTPDMKHPVAECGCPARSLPPERPQGVPFKVRCDDDVGKLKEWLLNYYSASSFNTCTHQPLPKMHGPPLRLMIDPDATPIAHHTPINVPIHWMDEVKAGLDRDVRLGVIQPVPVGQPVTWCHRMVVCAKKDGKPRRTVDMQSLNKHACRETHHTQSPYLQARSVPSSKLKTVFDCWNGYHSIALHHDDYHYTTFITPWGRYQYKVAPQGYIASGDGYCRRFDEVVSSIPNKTKCIDDTLLWADSVEESFEQAINWLDTCGKNGIILNPDKFEFAKHSVDFAGFKITADSVKPCDKHLSAIKDFPTPSTLTDIRSWFGLVNQMAYAFAQTKVMEPFRRLLKSNAKFHWDDQLEQVFQQSKLVILDKIEHGVRIFDKNRPTCLATDWSTSGVGYWLLQKHCHCQPVKVFCCHDGWQVTLVGSRFTSKAESHYSTVEGEALAVAYALDHARHFVLGCKNLLIVVDHEPLLKILNDRSLDISSNRLRNIKERTLRYRFTITHIPGAKNKAADAISRRPTGPPSPPSMPLP